MFNVFDLIKTSTFRDHKEKKEIKKGFQNNGLSILFWLATCARKPKVPSSSLTASYV